MEDSKSAFKLAMMPGLLIGGVSILISLLLWALVDDLEQQQSYGYFTWLIIAFLYFYYTKNYRNNELEGNMTYGEGFKFMFYISLVLSVLNAMYTYFLFAYLDPSMMETIKETAAEQLYQQNLPEDQIETAIEMQSAWITPGMTTLYAIFGSLFFGTIMSLVIAIFTKKEVVTFED